MLVEILNTNSKRTNLIPGFKDVNRREYDKKPFTNGESAKEITIKSPNTSKEGTILINDHGEEEVVHDYAYVTILVGGDHNFPDKNNSVGVILYSSDGEKGLGEFMTEPPMYLDKDMYTGKYKSSLLTPDEAKRFANNLATVAKKDLFELVKKVHHTLYEL